MRLETALLILLVLSPIALTTTSGRKPPSVVIVSNEADMPTAEFIGDLLNRSGLSYEILGPDSFKEALRNYEVLILLGGPEAYDGMGNITANYIPPKNASTLVEEPETFLISIFKGSRDIIVLAGHTRKETLDASAYFFKDASQVGITRLWGWAGYPVSFKEGSYAVYYVERYIYDNETGKFRPVPWGSLERRVLSKVEAVSYTHLTLPTTERV